MLLLEHGLLHFFGFPPLHAFSTLFRSFFLQKFLSVSAAQPSGDAEVARALPWFIPGAGSIFTGVAEGWLSGGVTARTQFSTHNAASILAGRGTLNLVRVAFFICEKEGYGVGVGACVKQGSSWRGRLFSSDGEEVGVCIFGRV